MTTDEKLKLLIKLTAREHRYACVDAINAYEPRSEAVQSQILNVELSEEKRDEILEEWRAMLENSGEDADV